MSTIHKHNGANIFESFDGTEFRVSVRRNFVSFTSRTFGTLADAQAFIDSQVSA